MDRQIPHQVRKIGGVFDPISLGFVLLGLSALAASNMNSQPPVEEAAPTAIEAPQAQVPADTFDSNL